MLIVVQWYETCRRDVLNDSRPVNRMSFGVTDTAGKQLYVCKMSPPDKKELKYCICIGDTVSAEVDAKNNLMQRKPKGPDPVVLGFYETAMDALSVLQEIVNAAEEGRNVFFMPY